MWFFSAIFAKIASAGAIAQAATGAGIVLVGFTGVGAAGALPAPVQHGFATVVAAITPLQPSDGTSDVQPAVDSTAPAPASSSADATTADSTETATTTAPATSTPTNFGQRVSTQAHNGGVSGKDVSSWAHERNAARKSAHQHGTDGADATSTEAPSTESEAPDTESADDSGQHGSDGQHSGGDTSGHGDH